MVFEARRIGRVLCATGRHQSMFKESDHEVNQSYWNTAKTRQTGHTTIQSRLPHSHHWVPPKSSYAITTYDLYKVPFSVGIDVKDDSLTIRSICVIHPLP